MTRKKLIILYLIAFICQLTVINLIGINNVGPNLILCLTVVIIFVFDEGWRCIPYSLGAALLIDVCAGTVIGAAPLALFCTGIFAEAARERLNTELLAPLAVTGAIATLFNNVVYWLILKILGNPMSILYILKFQIFYIIYNILVMFVIFYFMNKIRAAREKEEDEYGI